nr:unnamed protein product [Digitaria exilis]
MSDAAAFCGLARKRLMAGNVKCPGQWCRPTEYGGLGIHDMKIAAYSLRLRWLWLKRTDRNRPWKDLELAFGNDPVVAAMFQNSVDIQLGDGALALFWTDRWHGASSPCIAAADLCKLIKPATAKKRTVAQALANRTWISDIKGRLTIPALEQFIYLWHATNQCHLSPGTEDTFRWRWTPSGTYSAQSAYRQFFVGATRMAAAQPLWKAWAPLKVKFTI